MHTKEKVGNLKKISLKNSFSVFCVSLTIIKTSENKLNTSSFNLLIIY